MALKLKYLLLGLFLAYLVPTTAFLTLWFLEAKNKAPFREQTLPSGKSVLISGFNLVWGIEHSDRDKTKDSFALEYILSSPNADQAFIDQETREVFELARPISEQWGFTKAEISAFSNAERNDKVYVYSFQKDPSGEWQFERSLRDVFRK